MVPMLINDHCIPVGKAFSETVRDLMDYVAAYGYKKQYSLVDSTKDVYIKWIEKLGFVEEYIMREAGDQGQDLIGYAWEG